MSFKMLRKLMLLMLPIVCFGCFVLLKSLQDDKDFTNQLLSQVHDNHTDLWIKDGYRREIHRNSVEEITLSSENKSQVPYETLLMSDVGEQYKFVLLLSSVGRSGSSFLGELLSAQGHNIYIFEPIRVLPRTFHKKAMILDELMRNFRCELSAQLLSFGKTPYVSIRHPYVLGKEEKALDIENVRGVCLQEHIRIIKTIRTRLRWTTSLLEDKDLDFKVIHLVRDPRGSYVSMDELEWNVTAEELCLKIEEDLKQREDMEMLYPDKYYFIKYEELCLDPFGKTEELFRFLRGKKIRSSQGQDEPPVSHPKNNNAIVSPELYPSIPEKVFSYLQSHVHIDMFSKRSPWTTKRDTSSHYQKWRYNISKKKLLRVETHCDTVIRTLGHRAFGSLQNARNLSHSLFL